MVDPKVCMECERGNPVDIYPDGTRLHVHGGHAVNCTAASPNTPEPQPLPCDGPKAWDLVLADMQERDRIGTAKYKQRLTCGDGRNSLVDAYQEALDLAVYLRKEIEERKSAKDAEITSQSLELAMLRLAVEESRKALQKHHEWHQQIGTVRFDGDGESDGRDESIELDLSDAYADSTLCDETISALALLSVPGEPSKLDEAIRTFIIKWRRWKAREQGDGAREAYQNSIQK